MYAENYMGFRSADLVHQVRKESTQDDVEVILTGKENVNPGDVIQLSTVVTETPCSTINIAQKSVSDRK